MRNLEDYGTKTQSGRLRYKDAIWKITVQRRNLEDYGTKTQSGRLRYKDAIWKITVQRRNLEDYGTKTQSGRLRYKDAIWKITVQRRNLEDYGTKTQSGRLRYKAACAMMHTVDLAIIRVQTDKCQKLYTPPVKILYRNLFRKPLEIQLFFSCVSHKRTFHKKIGRILLTYISLFYHIYRFYSI